MVVVAGRIELPAEVRYVGVVDVVPLDARPRVQPEEPGVQAAAQMQDDGLGVTAKNWRAQLSKCAERVVTDGEFAAVIAVLFQS